MARFFPNPEEIPLSDQIKALGDDELLDFWEETQFLDKFLQEDVPPNVAATKEYERMIILELQLRTCMRSCEGR
ncbi:MAG: hypothetical protein H0S85_08410 [Desulfovibrionaceae bacterium]|nr:hypothetical protein [Desulfovibrionaceae bacterium]